MLAKRTLMKTWIPSILAAAGMLAVLILLAGNETAMNGIQRLLALISSVILNLFGQHTVVIGTTVQSSVFGISVVTACTGIFITGLFLIAVVALPARWMAKLIGAGIGIGGIFTGHGKCRIDREMQQGKGNDGHAESDKHGKRASSQQKHQHCVFPRLTFTDTSPAPIESSFCA